MNDGPRILFMGTPEFAVPSLAKLIEAQYPVVAVVTQPDRPKGRGKNVAPSPVKVFAQQQGVDVLQPVRVRDVEFIAQFRKLAPDMVVLVAFGQILPVEILEYPKLGCINVHPSLLPLYRGAAPINWTLIKGETKTGVSIMLMNEGMDSGDILLQEETPVKPDETFDHLHDRLAAMGAQLLIVAIERIVAGTARRTVQDHSLATFAPKIREEDGLINWNEDAARIVNRIRGLSSNPGAYTYLNGKKIIIFRADADESSGGTIPGEIGAIHDKGLPVKAGKGTVYLREVQLEGKKRMPAGDFLRGCRIAPRTVLTPSITASL